MRNIHSTNIFDFCSITIKLVADRLNIFPIGILMPSAFSFQSCPSIHIFHCVCWLHWRQPYQQLLPSPFLVILIIEVCFPVSAVATNVPLLPLARYHSHFSHPLLFLSFLIHQALHKLQFKLVSAIKVFSYVASSDHLPPLIPGQAYRLMRLTAINSC